MQVSDRHCGCNAPRSSATRLREEDVTGIAAIHHSLRDIDAGAGDVGLFVQISDFVDRAAVNAHPDLKLRMTLQRLANFQRAQDRRFRTVSKNERATVTGR